jgi:hypothetical protein
MLRVLVASILKIPEPAASPAAQWTSAGRAAAVAMIVLGAGFELAANAFLPETESTLDVLQWVADHPDLANLASVSAVLAVPFLLGTTLVYVLLSRQRSPRLAYTAGVLLGTGIVGLSAVEGYEALVVTLSQDGRFDLATLAEVLDEMSSPPVIAIQLIVVLFLFFGLLTSAAALWRSDAVPRGAVLLIPAFIVVDVVLHEGFGVVPASVGPAISLVGASWIAWSVLHTGRAVAAA